MVDTQRTITCHLVAVSYCSLGSVFFWHVHSVGRRLPFGGAHRFPGRNVLVSQGSAPSCLCFGHPALE